MGQDMDTTMIKTILVIEDDTNIGSLLVEALSLETPYNALLATDGFQAIDIVRTIKPCLFITDYCLPYMSGIELYDRLHSTRGLEDVPGIVMSAAYLPEGEIRKRQLVCLHKPFDLDDLLCTIDRLVAC
jgi:DNA-binding response OmpR family regulator